MCELIAKAKKSRDLASASMYPGELVEQEEEELQSANKNKITKTTTKKLPVKGSKCKAVTTEGTYYRFILAFFAEEMRVHVVQLGDQPTRDQLDNGDTNQMVRWKEIADYYNDADKEDLKKIPTTDSNLEILLGVKMVEPTVCQDEFDELVARECLILKRYLDFHYNIVVSKNRQSGSHADMHNFCNEKPYLYLYHTLLVETDNVVIKRQVVADLAEDTVRDSNAPKLSTKKKTPKRRRSNSGSVASSHKTKEQRFERVSDSMEAFIDMKRALLKNSIEENKEETLQKNLEGIMDRMAKQKKRLKEMQKDSDYNSDDSDTVVVKEIVDRLRKTRDEIRRDLQNHDQLKEDKEIGLNQSPVRCIQYGRGSDCSTL
jgi:hypothetical protein